ncbi:TIGR04086 family membrane protein [Paenibacillus sp. F411]|uniref:TIGR04086 family membrane protein n=1 Tax=Paenibacillus sp. F411 TaxID=2820239 RepID=UPI001AAF388E|nr:TIGR04086 family membrane protein [Paenibacillus sp. F411]MBO2943421.1 TIGR04086 family membrane protein [Paenibacillus sp. F411]
MESIRRLITLRITNPILSGLLHAFIWMFIGAFALSMLLWASSLSEEDLSLYTFVVHGAAAWFGGLASGRRSGSKGWYYGLVTGLLYGILLLIIGFLALNSFISASDMTLLGIVIGAGALGGMFGVNLRK